MTDFMQNQSAYPLLEQSKQRNLQNPPVIGQQPGVFGVPQQPQSSQGLFGPQQTQTQSVGGFNTFSQPGLTTPFSQPAG